MVAEIRLVGKMRMAKMVCKVVGEKHKLSYDLKSLLLLPLPVISHLIGLNPLDPTPHKHASQSKKKKEKKDQKTGVFFFRPTPKQNQNLPRGGVKLLSTESI